MKKNKLAILVALAMMSASVTATATDGGAGPGGGNIIAIEFKRLGHDLVQALLRKGIFMVGPVDVRAFDAELRKLTVDTTPQVLTLKNKIKDAINYPRENHVDLSTVNWSKYEKSFKQQLAAHEVLRFLKLDDKNYELSQMMISASLPEPMTPDSELRSRIRLMFAESSQLIGLYQTTEKLYTASMKRSGFKVETLAWDQYAEYSEEISEDYSFCNSKWKWFTDFRLFFGSATERDVYVYANHPRCRKFFTGYYSKNPSLVAEYKQPDTMFSDLPEEFINRARQITTEAYAARVKAISRRVSANLTKVAKNNNRSAMEVCAAIALNDILENFANDSDADRILNGANKYAVRLNFLAYTIHDWLAKSNSNTNLCPNFGLELKVEELSWRVNAAESAAREALARANEVGERLDKMQTHDMISSAAFWGAGFAALRLMGPR